jgi:hypothetical protein
LYITIPQSAIEIKKIKAHFKYGFNSKFFGMKNELPNNKNVSIRNGYSVINPIEMGKINASKGNNRYHKLNAFRKLF